jgi:hypothetical protein
MKAKFINIILLLAVIIPILFYSGCFSFKNIGSDLGEGLMGELKNNADTIGSEFLRGMVQGLTSDSSKQRLSGFIDSLITKLGYTTNKQLVGIRDSLLNDYVNRWVQGVIEDAVGNTTRKKLGALRDELLGDKTIVRLLNIRNSFFNYYLQQYLSEIEKNIGPNLFNDSTMQRIGSVRDTLIGSKSNALIKSIVDSAMVTIASRFNNDINPNLKGDLSFLQKNASWLFSLIGFIVLIIIWFVWRQKEKYLKMSKLLTVQIADVKEKNVFESLKENISKHAKVIGVEGDLRDLLNEEGLLHK